MENFNNMRIWLSPNPLLVKSWKILMLIGLVYAAIGVITLIWSQEVFKFFIYLTGSICIVFGGAKLYSAVKNKNKWSIVWSAVVVLIGIFITLAPLFIYKFIGYVIGIWIIISAIEQILSAVTAPAGISGKVPLSLSGIISIFFGIAVIIMPAVVIQLFGVYMLIHGIFAIASANAMREIIAYTQKEDSAEKTQETGKE